MTPRQLPLPLGFAPGYAASDFIADSSNAAARLWLADPGRWPNGRLALHGEAGRGKTHLLHVWAAQAGARLVDGAGLRLPLLAGEIAAIDDADLAAPEALLHTLNASAEAGHRVLLAAREPPGRWPVALPDLRSRLRATLAAGLDVPSDAMRAALLVRLLADRQLSLAMPLQDWLLTRLPRSAATLREVVARLDRASLAHGRALSRPLLADVLAGLRNDDDGPGDEDENLHPADAGGWFPPAVRTG